MKIMREIHDEGGVSELNSRQKNYPKIVSVGIKLCTVCILQPKNGSSILDNSDLPASMCAQVRNPVSTGIFWLQEFYPPHLYHQILHELIQSPPLLTVI